MHTRIAVVSLGLLPLVFAAEATERPSLQEIHLLLAGMGVTGAERFAPSDEKWAPDLFDRWGWYGAPQYMKDYEKVVLRPEILKDLDGDGKPEYIAVLKEETGEKIAIRTGEKAHATSGRLLVGVFKRHQGAWILIHNRISHPEQLLTAFLEDAPGRGVRIHVFESRAQCDDEEPHSYELRWDSHSKKIVTGFASNELDPLWKSVDCGE